MSNRKLGSIALARELCVQIAGYTDDDQDQCGHDYGSVDIAEILSAEVVRLQAALAQPEQEPVAYYHPRNGFYWAKPTSIFAPTVVDVPPIPLYTTAAQREWVGLTKQDMPSGEDPMFDHLYFIAGMVYADKVLKKKNT